MVQEVKLFTKGVKILYSTIPAVTVSLIYRISLQLCAQKLMYIDTYSVTHVHKNDKLKICVKCSTLASKKNSSNKGVQDCDVYVHRSLYCHTTNDTVLVVFMCVGRHLDEQGTHLHLETRTPVTHVQTQMRHNSSPQVVGMKVVLVSVTQAGYAPVSLPTLSCDRLAVQCVLQLLTFFG